MKRGCGETLLRNLGAELAALGQAVLVRGQVDNQAVRRHLGTRLDGALLPVAHPLSVAPVVGAEQHDLLAGKAALQLAKNGSNSLSSSTSPPIAGQPSARWS